MCMCVCVCVCVFFIFMTEFLFCVSCLVSLSLLARFGAHTGTGTVCMYKCKVGMMKEPFMLFATVTDAIYVCHPNKKGSSNEKIRSVRSPPKHRIFRGLMQKLIFPKSHILQFNLFGFFARGTG